MLYFYTLNTDYECLLNLFGGVFKKKRIVSRGRALALIRNFLKFLPLFWSSKRRGAMGGLPPHSISPLKRKKLLPFVTIVRFEKKGGGKTLPYPYFWGAKLPHNCFAQLKNLLYPVFQKIAFKKKELRAHDC
jgi:hypothetical protein